LPDIAVQLGGISCPSATRCELVGYYYTGGNAFYPLTEEWKK
jgi:hypothetical protein